MKTVHEFKSRLTWRKKYRRGRFVYWGGVRQRPPKFCQPLSFVLSLVLGNGTLDPDFYLSTLPFVLGTFDLLTFSDLGLYTHFQAEKKRGLKSS